MLITSAALAAPSRTACWAVQWLTWPLMFAVNLGLGLHAIDRHLDYASTLTALLLANVALLIALESIFPADERWKMTWRSLLRDLKYFAASGITIAASNLAFGLASL